MPNETESQRTVRWRRALAGERLPLAFVDLDAFDENVRRIVERVGSRGKLLRPATKSVRVPALLARIAELGGPTVRGLMTYDARETAFLVERGFDDLLLAYPTAQPSDAELLAAKVREGATIRVVCDAPEQVDALARAARAIGATIDVVAEVDLAFRPLGARVHLGVRRSPLRTSDDVVSFADRVARTEGARFVGVMGYEAQIAGVSDRALPRRLMRRASRRDVAARREDIARSLRARGHVVALFNGGGTGSVDWTAEERDITEVTAGSGFLDSHLFDHYRSLALIPAAHFALQIVRIPAPGIVTCAGGGYVASGAAGEDRLPIPLEGARLLPIEGAGEVQTPVVLSQGTARIGDLLFFRHAKAGELAEHFTEYLLVQGDSIVGRAPTYRGLGHCFLG